MALKRGWLSAQEVFSNFEAVEETLCFGWVDSVQKLIDGKRMQRFSPRKGNSPWTELNKARVRRLESLGRMTDAGRAVPPIIGPRCFRVDREIEAAMKAARMVEVQVVSGAVPAGAGVKCRILQESRPGDLSKAPAHLIEETKRGRIFGEWNDYGRLPDV